MTVQLTVRGTDGLRKWAFDEWNCLVAVASISAQPESMSEFLAAIQRYQSADVWSQTGAAVECIQDATTSDGQWCLVDLASRSVISGPEFELPERRSALLADGDEHGQGANVIWMDTPSDWLFEPAAGDWTSTVDQRAAKLGEQPRLDGRAVLYGADMLRFIADKILIAAASGVPEARRHELNRGVHVDWLMTARDDLCGKTPREWMLKDHEHIAWEMQHRSQQWSMQGFAAPPLDVSSVAYQYAAFGTTEIVTYFDLLRSLMTKCWQQSDAGVFDSDQMVDRLDAHLQSFLDKPPEDDNCDISRRQRIECERRRMPFTEDQTHLDCECSTCQASNDSDFGSQPMFAAIDASHLELEDEFAFSTITSRDDWERQQADDRRRMQELQHTQAPAAQPDGQPASDLQPSKFKWDTDSHQSPHSPSALAFPLAALINTLKQSGAQPTHADSLNRAFTAFRSASDLAAARSAAEELRASLDKAAVEFPELSSQTTELRIGIDDVLQKQLQVVADATAIDPQPALQTTTPILNVVVFRSPGPPAAEVELVSSEHTKAVSSRPLGGGLGHLTLQSEDFDRVADGVFSGDNVGTAAAVLHFMGPNAADLILQPQDLDYCWIVTDNTPFERVLMLQVVMRPHLLE